ncbi:MAG: hypothetical protein HN796_06805 [Gemmatimonadetes bacterium]|nr:hypothetical protein [Gemmatimonadota bacterium]
MRIPRHLIRLLALWVLVVGCHDSRRINPVDPALTPAVTGVAVSADDEAGVVFVEWSAYEGDMPFARYIVMRRQQGLVAEDTVAIIDEIATTRAIDTQAAPETDYEYRVITVNAAGFGASTVGFAVRSFRVLPVEIAQLTPDPSIGAITISWAPYGGGGFEAYEILRRTFAGETRSLARVDDVTQVSWVDTSAQPQTNYTYWLQTDVLGESLESATKDIFYTLTRPTLSLLASSDCACTDLEWSVFDGPRFSGYQVVRSVIGRSDTVVATISDLSATHYADSLLQGNTEYTYRIRVDTQWDGVEVDSEPRSGIFQELLEEILLPSVSDTEVQSLAIAMDDNDGRWVVSTLISSTTARIMRDGVRIHAPDRQARTLIHDRLGKPDRISPVRTHVVGDQLFGVVRQDRDSGDSVVVFSADTDVGLLWVTPLIAAKPVDLYIDESITDMPTVLVVLDEDAVGYLIDPDTGEYVARWPEEGGRNAGTLESSLSRSEALPIQDNLFAAGFVPNSSGPLDAWFLLTPQRSANMSIGRVRSGIHIGGQSEVYDDGIGLGSGQLLNPLVLDLDRDRERLVVVESRGILQVLDASDRTVSKRRGITSLGTFGQGPGQFFVPPLTAVGVAVDGQGRIHVADAATDGGRVQVFAR